MKIKEHRVQKSYGRVKEICIFRNLFEQLTLTYWGVMQYTPYANPESVGGCLSLPIILGEEVSSNG